MKFKTRNLLVIALACLTLFGALAGCSGPTQPPEGDSQGTTGQTSAAPEVKYADTIVISENVDCGTLDPSGSIGATETKILNHLYEGLVRESDDASKAEPWLAESWTISEDGLVYTFKLVPGVKFANGDPVTGEDWIWSLTRTRDYPLGNSRSMLSDVSKVEAPDDTTLVITLKQPNASFIANLTNWTGVVMSKKWHDQVGDENFAYKPMGTGPYFLTEWKLNEYMTFDANPYYHIEGKPFTKHLKYVIVKDDNTRLLQLQSGEVDIMVNVPPNMVKQVDTFNGVHTQIIDASQIRYLNFCTKNPPFDNVKVRQAFMTILNKQEMVDLIAGGYGEPVQSYFAPTHSTYWIDLPSRGPNLEKAKQMLAEAGYPNGFKTTLSIYAGNLVYEQIATIIKDQVKAAGIDVEILPMESATLKEKWAAADFNMTLLQFTDCVTDPSYISSYACVYANTMQWYTFLNDTEMEALYNATVPELDVAKRAEAYKKLQERCYEQAAFNPLYLANIPYGVSDKIQDLTVSRFGRIRSADLKMLAD